jgi:hypothetical protein
MPIAPDYRAQRAIDAIYELFFYGGAWPRFVDLDRFLDRRGEPDAEAVLLSMPPGLIEGVSPRRPAIQDEQKIRLTVAALASCDQASEDVRAFLAAVGHAADLEGLLEPGQPAAQLASDSFVQSVVLPAAGRQDLVARLGEILGVENWGWSSASHGDGAWSFVIDRRVRRIRDATGVEDYWTRTHPQPVGKDGPELPVTRAVEDGMDKGEHQLSIFISYSQADCSSDRTSTRSVRRSGLDR